MVYSIILNELGSFWKILYKYKYNKYNCLQTIIFKWKIVRRISVMSVLFYLRLHFNFIFIELGIFSYADLALNII